MSSKEIKWNKSSKAWEDCSFCLFEASKLVEEMIEKDIYKLKEVEDNEKF
jgi:hypothetical protein